MKTSPELLSSILQVLTKIEKKMGGESAEPSKPTFSDLITGKKSVKDIFKKKSKEEENTIKALSLGVEKLNKELKKVDLEKLDSIYKLLGRSKKLTEISTLFENIAGKDLVTFRNNLGELSQSILSLNSELDKLDVDTLSSIKEQFAKSNINITDFNQLVTNIDFSPLDNIADVVLKLNTAFDTLPIIQAENFRNSLIYLTDSSKKLMTEFESLSKVNVDILEKYSQANILEQSILSDTTLNKFALLKQHIEDSASKLQLMHNNFSKFDEEFIKQLTSAGNKLDDELIGKIKVFNDNINNTLVSLSTIKSNLTNLDISSLESLISTDINKNSLAGEHGIKNLLLLKKNINLLTEDTDTLFKKLSAIKLDIVNEIISKGGNLSLILNDLNTITFNPLNTGISESLDNLSRLNREISNIDISAIKNISSVSGIEIISEDVIKKIEDFKIKIYQSSENLIAFKDSLKLFDENGLNAISDAGITLNWIFGDLINDNLRNFSNQIFKSISDIRVLSNELNVIDVTNIQQLDDISAQLKNAFEKFDITSFGTSLTPLLTTLTEKNNELSKSLLSLDASRIISVVQEINKLNSKSVNDLRVEIDSLVSSISMISSQSNILNKFISSIDASKIAKLGKEITNIDIAAITKLQTEIIKLQTTLDELASHSKLLNDSISTINVSNISRLKTEISYIDTNTISILQTEIAALYNNLNNLSKSNLAANINAIISKLDLTNLNNFNAKLSKFSLDIAKSVSAEISSIDEIIKDISDYGNQLNSILSSINVNKLSSEISSLNFQPLDELIARFSTIDAKLKGLNSSYLTDVTNTISNYSSNIQSLYTSLSDGLKDFSAAFVKEINPASIFGDLTRDKIAAFKDNVANSSAAILQLNQELQNLSNVPLDKLSEIGGSLNSAISQIDISRIEEFKAQIQSFADSTKHLGAELKNLDAKPLDNISKSSDKPVNKDSLISMLLGNTSMKQWAMLRLNVGIIKKLSDNLDALSIGAENLSISLSKINFGEFNVFAELLNKDISDKSVFGNETSKNISAAAEQIKTLYENTEKFNQQLAQIDVNIVDNLVQSVSKPIEEVSIFSSSTSSIVDKFKTNMIKTSNAAEKLMKQFSGSRLKDFKLFLDVLNTKMKMDSLFGFLGDTKKYQQFSTNLKTFIESLQKLNKEFKPLESLNLKDLATFKDLIELTGKNFEKNALMSEKKSARIRNNLFLLAEGIAELNRQLEKTDANKLKDLSAGIDKLETPSKKKGFKEKISGFAHAAKETAMAVVYMGLGLVAFGAALVVTSKLLGVSPLGVLGFVLLTSVVMAASMAILATGSAGGDKIGNQLGVTTGEGKGSNTKTAIENAKNMGTALMYIAGGIGAMAISLVATKVLLGANSIGVAVLAIAGTVLAMTGLMYILGATAAITEVGIKASKDMGKAMMYMSGGILAFAITIALVPKILGINKGAKEGEGGALGTKRGWGGAIAGIGSIFLVIAGMVGVFALMGAASALIAPGVATAAGMAGAMALMSLGVLAVAFSSKILLSTFGKGTDKKPDGTDRGVMGKALATMGNVVAGLGAFGLFVLSSVGLLAGLGMPLISVPTLMGAVTLVGVSMALIMTAKSIKKVQETMEGVDATSLKLNIANMIDAVLNGVIRGITGDPNATVQDNRLDLDRGDIVQFRRVKKVLRIFGHIAGSISKFAAGLRAFSKVGEIASLNYDENGNPVIGVEGKIHVTEIAKSIADTFGLFLNSLVNNTQNLTRTQARSLKILSKSLVGKKGLISGVSEFAETINTFSKFGEKGEIYVVNEQTGVGTHVSILTIVKNITSAFSKFVQGLIGKESMFKREGEVGKRMHAFSKTLMGRKGMISAINDFANTLQTFAELGASGKMSFVEYDSNGEPIMDKPVTITSIVQNIVSAFSKFATGMGNEASKFNIGGGARNNMEKLTEALMGKKQTFGREKTGLLAGIMAFSELIQKLAGYGADGKIPRLDENGQIIPGSKPIEIDVVTKGIVAAITKFVTSLETELKGIDVSGADRIDTKLKSFSKVVDTLDKMSKSSDGIDRISTSIGSMAQNVQLLVESMGKLDVGKFESFSTAAATAAKNAPAVTTTSTANSAASQAQAQQLQTQQWNQMADTIGTKIAEKIAAGFLNGEFNFTFYNSTGGKLEISNA